MTTMRAMKLPRASKMLCRLMDMAIPMREMAANSENRTKIHFIFPILIPPLNEYACYTYDFTLAGKNVQCLQPVNVRVCERNIY
jgi:hypothetical protein